MDRTLTRLVLGLASIATAGCTTLYPSGGRAPRSYFAAVYRVRAEAEPQTIFDVRAADKLAGLRTTWHAVALRAPDTCNSEGSAGEAVSCTSWLSEIERGLVDAKLAVTTWSVLRDVERTKRVPTHVAARELGIDVVFVINRVEAEAVPFGASARESFDIYETDEDGRERRPAPVSTADLDATQAFARDHTKDLREELAKQPSHLTALLDVTAIDTKTGEAVWFYRKQHVAAVPTRAERPFLVAREGASYWPVYPQALSPSDDRRGSRSSDDSVESKSALGDLKSPGALAKQSQTLSRAVITDFLARFRGG